MFLLCFVFKEIFLEVQCDRSEAAILEDRQGPNSNWLLHMQVVALLGQHAAGSTSGLCLFCELLRHHQVSVSTVC